MRDATHFPRGVDGTDGERLTYIGHILARSTARSQNTGVRNRYNGHVAVHFSGMSVILDAYEKKGRMQTLIQIELSNRPLLSYGISVVLPALKTEEKLWDVLRLRDMLPFWASRILS